MTDFNFNHTSLTLLLSFLLRHFDTCIIHYHDNKSSTTVGDFQLKNVIHETIFQNQKVVVSGQVDNVNLHNFRKNYVGKHILNIFLITADITPDVMEHFDRIYDQSNQINTYTTLEISLFYLINTATPSQNLLRKN